MESLDTMSGHLYVMLSLHICYYLQQLQVCSPWHGQFLHSDVCPHRSGFGLAKMQQILQQLR